MVSNLWDDAHPGATGTLLDQRVYSSRLLGMDPNLVLHGGGNTSVKLEGNDVFGVSEDLLLVKGSGWDLATIEPAGFTPLLLDPVRRLGDLDALSDTEMAHQLARYRTNPSAPSASVEAILHALLPYRFVDHTHADAIVTLSNTKDGERLLKSALGESILVLPYVMPGFDLAKLVASILPDLGPDIHGIILMNHGIFTFGESAKESYGRMIDFVDRAETATNLGKHKGSPRPALPAGPERRVAIAELRGAISDAAGGSMLLTVRDDEASLAFAQRENVAELSRRGPATPDHVLRTKPFPLVGKSVDAFVSDYRAYFDRYASTARTPVDMLDPAPRVVLDESLGLLAAGRTATEARIAGDIYRHTIAIIDAGEELGGYRTLHPKAVFDVEYWDLEQAKLKLAGPAKSLSGRVALVTGAASGIGRAIAGRYLQEGAAVVGLDLNPEVESTFAGPSWLGLRCDVTDTAQVTRVLDSVSDVFGGLDILVLNAGIFPAASPVDGMSLELWNRVMRVNLDSAMELLREAHPMLRLSYGGGRVVVIGSKNVAAPGPGAAAYSASKAALTQLARVVALEWASDPVLVNIIHPDAVFDTGLWGGGVLEARADHYGMSVDDYRRRNLLHVEVTSSDVAELALAMVGPAFSKTTGAQVPIDGGNERVI